MIAWLDVKAAQIVCITATSFARASNTCFACHDSSQKFPARLGKQVHQAEEFFSQAEEFFCHIKNTAGFVSAFKL